MFRWSYTGATQEWRVAEKLTTKQCDSSSMFATALAAQSRQAVVRFTHCPEVVRHLREYPDVINKMETCVLQLHHLEDLLSLLQCVRLLHDTGGGETQLPRFICEMFSAMHSEETGSHAREESSFTKEMELICWLQMLLWTRCFAVFFMQRLVAIHGQISWYAWYWSWAEINPMRSSFHMALCCRWWWRFGLLQKGWAGHPMKVRSIATAHKTALNRTLRRVVRSLGTVYSLIDRMNALVSSAEESVAADTHKHLLEPQGDSSGDYQAAEHQVLHNLKAVVSSTIMLLARTVCLKGCGSNDVVFGGIALNQPMLSNDSFLLETHSRAHTDMVPPQLLSPFSLKDVLQVLCDTVELARNGVQTIGEEARVLHMPPHGRHWQRVFFTGCIVLPSALWLFSRSKGELLKMVSFARVTLHSLTANYVVYPLREICGSLFSGRPGVTERRRTLEMEMDSVANIIRDYHEDYYPNISQAELRCLRDSTFEHLRSGVVVDDEGFKLINRHYETAIRHPIRNAIFGNLLRLMLIQLTYQQLEVMRVVNSTDEVLEGNDLNFKVMAMVPVLVFLGGVLLVMFQKRRSKLRPVNRHLRQCWRSVHRIVSIPESFQDREHVAQHNHDTSSSASRHDGILELVETRSSALLNNHDQGMLLLLTHQMRRLALGYHAGYLQLQEFLEDLDDLESTHSARSQRLLTLNRMRQTHFFLC